MRRREWLAMMGTAALLARASAANERPFRIYMAIWRGMTDVERGFQDYLAKRAVPVEYIWRDAGQERAKLPEFLREIRETRPDLVYAWGTSATLGLAGPYDQPTALPVPLVFALVAQPIAAKIVPRLRGQGRDVTGVYHVAPVSAQLEAMGAYLPFNRVGVLYNDSEANSAAIVEELRGEMIRRRMRLIEARFRTDSAGRPLAEGIEERVHEIAQAGAQWLYLGPDSYLFTQIDRIAAAAAHERLPTFATTEALLEGSAPVLAGLISRYRSVGEFAAHKAEQILAGGRRARDVPVETLARFAFVVRVDVARGIDVLPPITLFNYAEFR
jgi:putative ABC transport system substrate-binding protein